MLEASINRAEAHAIKKDWPFVIISASKGTDFYFPKQENNITEGKYYSLTQLGKQIRYAQEQNNIRERQLQADIKELGYGYFKVQGHYREVGASRDEDFPEKSFFVIDNKGQPDKFRDEMMFLGEKYDQECIVWKNVKNGKFYWLYTLETEVDGKTYRPGDTRILGAEFIKEIKADLDGVIRGAYSTIGGKEGQTFLVGNKKNIEDEWRERNPT